MGREARSDVSGPEAPDGLHMHRLQTDILGPVRVFPFTSSAAGEGDTVAIFAGSPEKIPPSMPAPLLRLHSRCLYGELFGSRDCDCLAQYRESIRLILDERDGILCYLEQEGRGKGLMKKALAYEYMQQNNVDTVEAYRSLHYELDPRSYSHVASFLKRAGISRVRLITNNPRKVDALRHGGIDVDRVPVVAGINHWNISYIEAKINKLGHLINVDLGRETSTREDDG